MNEKIIRQHYDNTTKRSLETKRENSKNISLRNFHNWIKSVLITKCLRYKDIVVDLCCGRGGDVLKYNIKKPQKVFFLDCSSEAIEECKRRYLNMYKKQYQADFIVTDCFKTDLKKKILEQVDAVSCQFSLHYAFESKEKLFHTLKNVYMCLKRGGIFFGIIADGNSILESTNNGEIEQISDNSIVCFTDLNKEKKDAFGISYTFSLDGEIYECPEYLVRETVLKDSFKATGFRIIEYINLWDFYRKNYSSYQELFKRLMGDRVLSNNERVVSGLYSIFCAIKE